MKCLLKHGFVLVKTWLLIACGTGFYAIMTVRIKHNRITALELVPVTVTSLSDTSVVGDVIARRSKMHGELVSLKQRPMTSHAVCYRPLSKLLCNVCGFVAVYLSKMAATTVGPTLE